MARGIRGQWQPYSQPREVDLPRGKTLCFVKLHYLGTGGSGSTQRRCSEPLKEAEVVKLSGEMVVCIGVAREGYVRELAQMSASETWSKRVAHDIVKSVWYSEESSTGACAGSRASEWSQHILIFWGNFPLGISVKYLGPRTFARLPNDTGPWIL